MALPKKARAITVNGVSYRWMTSRASDILCVPVLIQEAAGTGPLLDLALFVKTEWRKCGMGDSEFRLVQATSVTPRLIRKAIIEAIDLGWDPFDKNDLRFSIDWDGSLRAVASCQTTENAPIEIDDNESWNVGDPLAALTHYLTEYRTPHPLWVKKWTRDGLDPVFCAWQQTADPAVMMGVLVAARDCSALKLIMHAFAFQTGRVGELLELPTMGFKLGTGWQRHLDGANQRLSESEKLRSIREDIELLSECARDRADINDFRIAMIETTNIGTHGDWETFLTVTADLLRSIVPQPPTLDRLLKTW